jgi:hypothetical protein
MATVEVDSVEIEALRRDAHMWRKFEACEALDDAAQFVRYAVEQPRVVPFRSATDAVSRWIPVFEIRIQWYGEYRTLRALLSSTSI